MAWRIDEKVLRGEIDNRTPGRVSGRIWFAGREQPVLLDLAGNPWRDLAGHLLRFSNPQPQTGDLVGLADVQTGVVGDITASRKVKVPEVSMEELMERYAARKPFPWHWANSLYLEWFSESNGRVVIESSAYQLELEPAAAWHMSEAQEAAQRIANADATVDFMGRLGAAASAVAGAVAGADDAEDEEDVEDEDAPRSAAEAKADAEDARMQLLMDRVTARLEREGHAEGQFERICEEERERLRRERGEKPTVLTPEQEAERSAWIEEMNAVAAEAMADYEAGKWQDEDPADEHPLVERCSDLAVKLHQDLKASGWISEDDHSEHPLREITDGVMIASAKLAGALGRSARDEEWPPSALFAGNVLVRLKKARGYLRDAIRGLDSADEEGLTTPEWRASVRPEVTAILAETQDLIREVRAVLKDVNADGE
ncbi:MAG: hypothetical protein NTW21_14410 [Verrucomicrobia bacterium]|nr:hypothetical protein [Verrucomicrobiota bacterium]